ncbi:multidrug effflux MFS transporter [Marivita sp. S6314]|uniref:multidrug effflux MFS transporter n=1 Tax=Marivita sp. S6314 TaxID=2926406 RepID=UPI001FF5C2DA|nr:multidrug effflux MFS transporter [Marivita sp. S6314]MCK0148501.1 multidrug effflux MFS transporter [Marivita sp. S6314]
MPHAMPRNEFIALMAMLAATVALSIDAMLPALPAIGAELSPGDLNRAQLIITSFVLGMGVGTFFTGPLSDTFGRKPVMLGGAAVYMVGAIWAAQASSIEGVLAARVLQGLGAAGPRVVAMAVTRDLHSGREMARIVSFIMIVFTIVPAIAPLLGAWLIAWSSWRAVFYMFVVFSALTAIWLATRLPETLAPENRRPFQFQPLKHALIEVLSHPIVRISVLVQCVGMGMLFSVLSSTQQIFDITFGRADSFPYWFGGIAVAAASSGFLNAALVTRLGMRFMVTTMFMAQVVISAVMVGVILLYGVGQIGASLYFAVFIFWQFSLFFQAGMTIGNLNAIAQEPMGHIAGTAASVIAAVSTVVAALLAIPVGLLFNGTPLPLAVAILIEALAAIALMRMMAKRDVGAPTPAA